MGRKNTRVLISGASIAGPALAFWLERYGFEVTIIEKACDVRWGGQAVDFKGATHRTVLDRMGILDDVLKARSANGGDGVIVDAYGRTIGMIPAAFSGGEVQIRVRRFDCRSPRDDRGGRGDLPALPGVQV